MKDTRRTHARRQSRFTFSIADAEAFQIDQTAARMGVSRAELMRKAIEQYLAQPAKVNRRL